MADVSGVLDVLHTQFGAEAFSAEDRAALQPWVEVSPAHLVDVCTFLRDDPRCWFDLLESLAGVDLPAENRLGCVYHLTSIPHGTRLVLKCFVDRAREAAETAYTPTLPSLAAVWRTAEWHEREAYDLYGLHFASHPDLRRMFMPDDWPGHPLRKDYTPPEDYHDVEVGY